ncbi:probable b mating type locus, bW1 allele [Ustilago bromivora]|uniref:Probable b mating type locus, bW1 allele n=1 Tax=Ustilago bromivora TaxID=307758 RepID=A0A1K0FVG4_9BASI|nr:probable b mating type locus, bW1 allele [Ustilago bromivora]
MAASTLLHQVNNLASQLHSMLPGIKRLSEPISSQNHATLKLSWPIQDYIIRDIEGFGITGECRRSLVAIYKDKIRQLCRLYEEVYDAAHTDLHQRGFCNEGFAEAFRELMARKFSLQAWKAWHTILDAVKTHHREQVLQHVEQTEKNARHPRLYESHDSTKPCRGHDSDAVRILEQAFQHTPNITQAEKYRLAEVTGLKPKQVTIWLFLISSSQFQNRRNRKGRKGPKTEPTSPSQHFDPLPESPHIPSSPSTRVFTLSEKKRKTYGALGRGSPSLSVSDSDDSSLSLKKPRFPRACSTTSEASASSLELKKSFTSWGSPSSRSTSSSSTSSSQSDCFDSPGRAYNVFRLINPLKYEGHAKQDMPAVNMATPPQPTYSGVRQEQRSPFTSDNVNLSNVSQHQQLGFHTDSGDIKLNFGDLQFNQEALHKGLRESIQKALDISAMRQESDRSVSGSSWATIESTTTDDDVWIDEDKVPAAPLCNTPVSQAVVEQRQPPSFGMSFQQSQPSNQIASSSSNTTTDSSFSLADENDSFDLNQFFESAASAPATFLPSSSPFVPHQQYSPQASLVQTAPTIAGGMDAANSCLDFEVEMSDIQDYLNSSFLAPAPIQPSMAGVDGEGAITGGSQRQVQGGETPAQFYLNFELGPEMFSLE